MTLTRRRTLGLLAAPLLTPTLVAAEAGPTEVAYGDHPRQRLRSEEHTSELQSH